MAVCAVSGTVCALASLALHAKLFPEKRQYIRPTQYYYQFINWSQLSSAELEKEVLKLVFAHHGLLFGWENPFFARGWADDKLSTEELEDDEIAGKQYKDVLMGYLTSVAYQKNLSTEKFLENFKENLKDEEVKQKYD